MADLEIALSAESESLAIKAETEEAALRRTLEVDTATRDAWDARDDDDQHQHMDKLDIERLRAKTQKYSRVVEELSEVTTARGLSPALRHHNIVEQAEQLRALQQRANELEQKLERFHGIPPCPKAAKESVEAKKAEFQERTRVFENLVTSQMYED